MVNEENCLLYRYEDYEVLAQDICRLFEDADLRQKLSQNASTAMQMPKDKSDYEKMSEVLAVAMQG